MKLSEIRTHLAKMDQLRFKLPGGKYVPANFHVTEVGVVEKHFIDCGGIIRSERLVNFQLWAARETAHRLEAQKLLKIIELSEKALAIGDGEIEVEYQSDTIGRYGLECSGEEFLLTAKHTACLAQETCGDKTRAAKSVLPAKKAANGCCGAQAGCC